MSKFNVGDIVKDGDNVGSIESIKPAVYRVKWEKFQDCACYAESTVEAFIKLSEEPSLLVSCGVDVECSSLGTEDSPLLVSGELCADTFRSDELADNDSETDGNSIKVSDTWGKS